MCDCLYFCVALVTRRTPSVCMNCRMFMSVNSVLVFEFRVFGIPPLSHCLSHWGKCSRWCELQVFALCKL